MFWFIEANVQLCDTHTLKAQNFKVMRERHGSPSSSHLQSQRLWSWTTPNYNNSSSRRRCSDMIFMGRWNTNGSHAILPDFWLGINTAMEINQGPLFEACSSVVFESDGITWKSTRCWTLTRLTAATETIAVSPSCWGVWEGGVWRLKCVYLLC